jgi:nickel-dependent lactate racemase
MRASLKFGNDTVEVDIPDAHYSGTLLPRDAEGVPDPSAAVGQALANPIDSKSLKELVSQKNRIVIIASDISRPSPSHILIPPILDELQEAGITDDKITIVFALGIHRDLTEDEMKKLVGENVYNRVRCINHDIGKCVRIGVTKKGTPVEVFKEVLDADFIIATGNIEFHFFAGYSGGVKAVAPGVCSRSTVQANHKHSFENDARGGKFEGNPVREDLDEMGRMIGIGFMVNAILNSQKQIIKVVAGDVFKAHREGMHYVDKMFRITLEGLADIVIISPGGYPKDIDLYQTNKAIENGILAVRNDGIIIVVAECRDGLGEDKFYDAMTDDIMLQELIDELKHDFILGRHKASRLASIHKNTEIYLVSNLLVETKDSIFMNCFDSVQEALGKALETQNNDSKVLVIPYGNSTLPFISGSADEHKSKESSRPVLA